MTISQPVKLSAVIPVGATWQRAKKHQKALVKHYLGYLRNGNRNFVIIDKTGDMPILEAAGKRFPMLQDIDGRFTLPQVHPGLRIRLNDLSGVMTLI